MSKRKRGVPDRAVVQDYVEFYNFDLYYDVKDEWNVTLFSMPKRAIQRMSRDVVGRVIGRCKESKPVGLLLPSNVPVRDHRAFLPELDIENESKYYARRLEIFFKALYGTKGQNLERDDFYLKLKALNLNFNLRQMESLYFHIFLLNEEERADFPLEAVTNVNDNISCELCFPNAYRFKDPIIRELRWALAVRDDVLTPAQPDKCWAGICLLGVTCQECSSDRFLASYSVWYQKLLSPLQSPTTSQFVKVASCASMSDLLTRLGEFPIVRKDGTAFAGKLIQSVLKLIDDGHSEIVWEEAVRLLCIFISFFPFSISRHYDSVSGICVRVFLKDPKFSLRNPKRFLEGLLDQYLSSIAATHSETQAVDPELPLQIILDTLHLCPNLWLLWQCGPNFLSSLWS